MPVDAGTGFVDILPRVNQAAFNSQLRRQVEPALSRMGKSLSSAGRSLTRNVSLPLVGLGVVAGKMALDFEDAFTRIAALSNASAQDIREWREEVLALAGETAQAPQELADALFFLSSAGLKANQIMPALEAAARGSAIGLGETADVANITASALNAYAGSGLKAAQVTDILVAAIREGRAEPEEFAVALGRILPIASKAGVSFDQVAASLAGLSNVGLDVNEGVTAMRGLLQALVAPGSQAADTLKEVGLSASEVRDAIAEDGLLGAMRLLDEATNGNIDQLRKIIPNIRALTGQFGLTGQEAEKVSGIFDRVADSTGDLDKAFGETEKGAGFRFQQQLAKLRVAAIELGEQLIPIGLKIVEVVSGLATAFSHLSPAMQSSILKFAALAVVAGPLLRIFGGLFTLVGGGVKVFRVLSGAVAASAATSAAAGGQLTLFSTAVAGGTSALVPFAAALGVAVVSFAAFKLAAHRFEEGVQGFTDTVDEGTQSVNDLSTELDHNAAIADEARGSIAARTGEARLAIVEEGRLEEAVTRTTQEITKQVAAVNFVDTGTRSWLKATLLAAKATDEERDKIAGSVQALAAMGGALTKVERQHVANLLAVGDFNGALEILHNRLRAVTGRFDSNVRVNVVGEETVGQLRADLAAVVGVHAAQIRVEGGASGGIVGAQHGGITRGPTLLTGESHRPTPFGRGTEAILPFDSRGIGILSEAIDRAMHRRGADSPDVARAIAAGIREGLRGLEVSLEGERVGRIVTRQQTRHRALVGD